MLTVADVGAAARRLAGMAHRTPILTSRTLDGRAGASVLCKAENLQRVGAFKFRGAYNAVAGLEDARGVVTYSSGNHGQAVALAASLCGVAAVVVMPTDAPALKRSAVAGYGAEIVEYDRFSEDRRAIAESLAADRAFVVVPPFDDWAVMAGQGTVALELFDDHADVDTLVVPVGGGGLISGCATVAEARGRIRVVGVEPEAGDDVRRSLAEGRIVEIPQPVTIADGQATRAPGEKTFAVMKRTVDEIVTVSDAEIVAAMRFAFERMKTVLEPSGASGLAALLAGRVAGKRIGVVLSGGNIGAEDFAHLISG